MMVPLPRLKYKKNI